MCCGCQLTSRLPSRCRWDIEQVVVLSETTCRLSVFSCQMEVVSCSLSASSSVDWSSGDWSLLDGHSWSVTLVVDYPSVAARFGELPPELIPKTSPGNL